MLSIQGEDPDLAAYCAEVKKRALRRIGQLMDQQPKAKGGEPYYDDPRLDQPSALGSPRRRILGRKITDCRPIKLVAAMSEQRQEPVVQKTGQRHRYAHFFGRREGESRSFHWMAFVAKRMIRDGSMPDPATAHGQHASSHLCA